MSHRITLAGRLAAILGALAVALAACSTPAAPGGATPSPIVGLPSGLQLPSFGSDASLEARLPNEFCGQATVKTSFTGEDTVGDDEEFAALVRDLGRSPADVSVATAGSAAPECVGIALIAFRIAGADPGRYEQLFTAIQTADIGSPPTRKNVGGKDVWAWTDADGLGTYIYFSGDIAFGVTAETEEDAAKGLAVMP